MRKNTRKRIEDLESSLIRLRAKVTDLQKQMWREQKQIWCAAAGGHKMTFVRREIGGYGRWYVFQCVNCSFGIRKTSEALTKEDKKLLKVIGVQQWWPPTKNLSRH